MFFRSTLIYGPAVLLTRLSSLLLLIVATRLLDLRDYGLLTLVVTVGEMTDVALTNWLRVSLIRLGGKGQVSRGSVLLAGRVLFVSTGLALALSMAVSAFLVREHPTSFFAAVAGYLIAGAIGRLALTILQMQQRHLAYTCVETLRSALQLLLPIASMAIAAPTFLSISLASSAATLCAGLTGWFVVSRYLVQGPARFTFRAFFSLGLPLIAVAVLGFGLQNAERLFLKAYHDAGAVAVFAATYALARQPIDMIANAINMGAFPEVVSRFDAEGPDAAARMLSSLFGLILMLCLPAASLLVVLSPNFTAVVLPTDYAADPMLFLLIAASVISANLTSFVYGTVIHAHKQPWLLTLPNAFGSMATMLGSVLLIPEFGARGAGLSLLAGSFLGLVVCIVIARRLTAVPAPWRDVRRAIGLSAACALSAFVVSRVLSDQGAMISLVSGILAGAVAFCISLAAIDRVATRSLMKKLRARLSPAELGL